MMLVCMNGTNMDNANMDSIKIINDNELGVIKGEIDILAKEKQIKNVNSEIYYTPKQEQNFNNTKQNQ